MDEMVWVAEITWGEDERVYYINIVDKETRSVRPSRFPFPAESWDKKLAFKKAREMLSRVRQDEEEQDSFIIE